MKAFRDNEGREWIVAIHVAAIKRVRGLLGLDLLGLIDGGFEGLGRFLADPIALVDALYVLCKDEADRRQVSDEDFGRAMAGDAIERAAEAFLAEYVDFFQGPRREALRKMAAAGKAIEERMIALGLAELEALDLDAVASGLIDSSGGSQGSSASIPDPSPSGS